MAFPLIAATIRVCSEREQKGRINVKFNEIKYMPEFKATGKAGENGAVVVEEKPCALREDNKIRESFIRSHRQKASACENRKVFKRRWPKLKCRRIPSYIDTRGSILRVSASNAPISH